VRRGDGLTRRRPLTVENTRFTVRVPVAKLRDGEDDVWELWAVAGGTRLPVALPEDAAGASWRSGVREIALVRTRQGEAALVERDVPPVLTGARWSDDGALELTGELPAVAAWDELVLVDENRGAQHGFALEPATIPQGFTARLQPARIESLAGARPLPEGTWRVCGRRSDGTLVPALVARELHERLPRAVTVAHKPFALDLGREERAVLQVERDLDDDERGPYHQRRLRETAYSARRHEPLRDAVVYTSFGGRQYSDSPRAIHEELVRRGAPLEHLWVVRDGACRPPASATAVREGSRAYHEALAQARYVISNDHFPDWFLRRPDQVCVQTWHGTPLKRLGLDVSDMRNTIRRFQRRWDQQVANWQYVISPNPFSTPILRRAYAIEGEMLETGYPRNDVLARPDRDDLAAAVRRRLDLPDGVRTVLYAPTYRDQVRDRRGRYRLDLQLDIERLHATVGDDTVILFRKHHYVADAVPATPDGFVRDVSSYPDGTELMLAADVLLTDYSSMIVDYANTGRPMLFFTYDLDAYRDEIRGFYLDFVATVPGPLLGTTDEVADALGDLAGVENAYAERYRAFRETFCALDDGGAAARVVNRIFSP
jgi:CDP-glycerol glycerophosphotransferase